MESGTVSKVQIVYSVDGANGLKMHMQLIRRRMKEISKKKRERNWNREPPELA